MSPSSATHVAIVGGAGYIGRALARALSPEFTVASLDKSAQISGIGGVRADLACPHGVGVLRRILTGKEGVTIIVASGLFPRRPNERNGLKFLDFGEDLKIVRNLGALGAELDASLVFLSSLPVGRRGDGAWVGELHPYFEAKSRAEELLRESGVTHLILRLARVIGLTETDVPELPGDLVSSWLTSLLKAERVRVGRPGAASPYLHIADLCLYLRDTLRSATRQPSVVELGSPDVISTSRMFDIVLEESSARVSGEQLDFFDWNGRVLRPPLSSPVHTCARDAVRSAAQEYVGWMRGAR